MNVFELSVNKNVLKTLFGYFILIDILILPYFQLIIMPLSLPLLVLFFVSKYIKIKNNLDFKLIIGVS